MIRDITKPVIQNEDMDSSQEAGKCNNLRCKSNVGGEVGPICTADKVRQESEAGREVCALSPCYTPHIKQDKVND